MLTLEGHWAWVWSAYAVGLVAFGALALASLARLGAARRRLSALEDARPDHAASRGDARSRGAA